MHNIILCGGSGTRLWPLSRKLMPKQFLKLFNGHSLFQLTLLRNTKYCDKFTIISNSEHYFILQDQIDEISIQKNDFRFILEPFGQNTAPAIAFGCFGLDSDEIVFVTPSDHLIKNTKAYEEALKQAKEYAKAGNLVVFGIEPVEPNTGYGYIEAKEENVIKFHEKPDIQQAKKYLQINSEATDSHYYWNSGMFMFQAGVYLEELQKHAPKIYETSKRAFEKATKLSENTIKIKDEDMAKIPSDSIDYAVMENSAKIKVVPSSFGWNDVGSFDSLSQEIEGNKPIEVESRDNFVLSQKSIALIGVEDLIVVDTPDALLIAKKGMSQKVKEIFKEVQNRDLALTTHHLEVHRPWGTYEVLTEGNNYKIKRIVVKPGKRLSLQKHFHRNEHWIVVSGTAEVTVGDKTYLIRPNESTYIKMGEVHRLANPGKIPVVLIEAQVGDYMGEDDIVRLDDDFRRD